MAVPQELQTQVLAQLEQGVTLRKACKAAGLTHTRWLNACNADPDLANQYARARAIGYELLADELLEISDDSTGDTYEAPDGSIRTDQEVVGRARLRVDTRKWILSKMLPKVYGDRVTHDGSVNHNYSVGILSIQVAQLVQELRGQGDPEPLQVSVQDRPLLAN